MIPPESQGGPNVARITIICSWTFLAIAFLGACLLVWARRIQKRRLGLDDYLTLLALATTVALIVQTTWAIVDEGQDNHEAEVSKTKFALLVRVGLFGMALLLSYLRNRQSLLVNQTLWGVANTLIRTSAILFFKKVFESRRSASIIAQSLLVMSILYGLVVFLEVFLICRPMAVDWNAHVDGTCGDQIVSYLVLEVLGLLFDLTIAAVSIPYLWALQMPLAKKCLTQLMFSIGALQVLLSPGPRICTDLSIESSLSRVYESRLSTWLMPRISPTQKVILVCSLH